RLSAMLGAVKRHKDPLEHTSLPQVRMPHEWSDACGLAPPNSTPIVKSVLLRYRPPPSQAGMLLPSDTHSIESCQHSAFTARTASNTARSRAMSTLGRRRLRVAPID